VEVNVKTASTPLGRFGWVLVLGAVLTLGACGPTHSGSRPVATPAVTSPSDSGTEQFLYQGADGTIVLNLVVVPGARTITGSGYIGPGTVTLYGAKASADCRHSKEAASDGCIVCSTTKRASWANGKDRAITVLGKYVANGYELTLIAPAAVEGRTVVSLQAEAGDGPGMLLLWPHGSTDPLEDVFPGVTGADPAEVAAVDAVSESCNS
jgi:hypothetical protein